MNRIVTAHNGDPIDVEVTGQGPALLMLWHPNAVRGPLGRPVRQLCGRIVHDLADRYRLVMIKYPSPPKPDTLTPDNVTADMLAVAEAVDAATFGWWGYSWSAVVGLQLAVASRQVDMLICGGFPPLGGQYAAMAELSELLLAKVSRMPGLGRTRRSLRQWVTYYAALEEFHDAAVQSQLRMPRLAFAGDADVTMFGSRRIADIGPTLVERSRELESLGWDVRVLPGLKHRGAMKPDVMVPLVSQWLRSASSPAVGGD